MHRSRQHLLSSTLPLGILLIGMLTASFWFSITVDAMIQDEYGKMVWDYYRTYFQDRRALSFSNLYLYGGFFDGWATYISRLLPFSRFYTRHLLSALCGWFAIYYGARIARRHFNNPTALLVMVLFCLTPRFLGEAMNNPKDIPFAAAMTAGVYYILECFSAYPKLTWRHCLKAAIAVAIAINMRSGGILLFAYWILALGAAALDKKKITPRPWWTFATQLGKTTFFLPLALVLGTIFWPWALQEPFTRPFIALHQMSQFEWHGHVLFLGEMIPAKSLPWTYVPVWFLIGNPGIMLGGVACGVFFLLWQKQQRWRNYLLLFFGFFPLIYVMANHSTLYDGVRHLLFVYPILLIIAAVGLYQGWTYLPTVFLKRVWITCWCVAAAFPLIHQVRAFPVNYVYFNALVGGAPGAFQKFDMDYYGHCAKPALHILSDYGKKNYPQQVLVLGSGPLLSKQLPVMAHFFDNLDYQNGDAVDFYVECLRDSPSNLQAAVTGTPDFREIGRVEVDGVPLCIVRERIQHAYSRF